MSVEIGTEAAQFPEKEYINGIFVAMCDGDLLPSHYISICNEDQIWTFFSAILYTVGKK